MSTEQAILKAWMAFEELKASSRGGDPEFEHGSRDDILLELLDALDPDLASAMREREIKVGYWYA